MRIAVIGAGAVGGALAALLHRGGHDVQVTARGTHLTAIRERGIRLRGAWGEHTARVDAAERIAEPVELVIVTTKAQDARAAIADNLAVIGDATVLVVQNGLDAIEVARQAAPHSPVLGGLAMFAASYLSPGEVTITAPGPTFVGGDGAASMVRLLPELELTLVGDFAGAQWSKLVVNQVNALPAITGLSAQETIASPALRRILVASMRETVRVGLASGVHFASVSGLSDARLRLFASAPFVLAQVIPRLMARRMGDVPNPGSTLQSIRRGQLSEIDYLNGAVVAAGAAAGVPTPVNAALVQLVHEVEASGEFFSAQNVILRVEPVETSPTT